MRGGGPCISKPPVRVAAEPPATAPAPAPAQTASVSASGDGAAAHSAASPATQAELPRGDAAATTPDAVPAADPQTIAELQVALKHAESRADTAESKLEELLKDGTQTNVSAAERKERPMTPQGSAEDGAAPVSGGGGPGSAAAHRIAQLEGALHEARCRAEAAAVELEALRGEGDLGRGGSSNVRQEIHPVVQEAEDDLLSLWLMRGAGTSGDAAVAELFPEGAATLDDEQLGAVMREKLGTDMDPIHVRKLWERLAGASGNDGSLVLSKEALNLWMRRRFPAFQIRQMLASVDLLATVVEQLLPSSRARGAPPPDGLGHLKSLRKADVRRALLASLDEWEDDIWTKVSHFQKAASGAQQGGGNLKFAGDLGSGDKVFEGKFETSKAFDEGLEKLIGLPDPKVNS